MKYILDAYGNFAIFSEVNTHKEMATGFYQEPVSAGFCKLIVVEGVKVPVVRVWGESVSLGLHSREEDEAIINRQIRKYYYENKSCTKEN